MKHFMLPKSTSPSPLMELSSTSPNPNPNFSKSKPRKQKSAPKDKENSDPSDFNAGKPSPGVKLKSPLPPRPPQYGGGNGNGNGNGNPLKRKLSNDAVFLADFGGSGGGCSGSCLDDGVKVVVRMRPLNKDEQDGESIVKKVSNDSLTINGHNFTFDSVADIEATQLDIYQLVGAPLVENCLAGFNSSVFAYGQTGSGKTYTMWGPANALLEDNLANEQQGLTPRVFEQLFARINEEQIKHADKQLKYQCRCSFLEIYNEQITDLLDPSQKNLQIREDVKSGVYVENLTEECVSTPKDVIQLLLKGLSHRRTGATSINVESSRSHSVFTCVVESQCKSMSDGISSFKTSRINLVDLAGSERQKLTGAAGERLKEASNINRSLSQLGNLINILAEISQTGKQRHIPYRDSRLTFLLQESLGGNAKMAMICAISPAQSCKSETFSTLRFAQRAKAIKNKAVVNEVMQDDVNVLREVIRQLRDELLRMKANGNPSDPNSAYANSWNARRSLNLLKFSLNRPTRLQCIDDDGDEEMEIDEEAVEKLCNVVAKESSGRKISACMDGHDNKEQQLDYEEKSCQDPFSNLSTDVCIEKQTSESSDVTMEEAELDDNEIIADGDTMTSSRSKDTEENVVDESPCKPIKDGVVSSSIDVASEALAPKRIKDGIVSSSTDMVDSEALAPKPIKVGNLSSDVVDSEALAPKLSVSPCNVSPILPSPPQSISPRLVSNSRKSLRTSSILSESQKDIKSFGLDKDMMVSLSKPPQTNSQLPTFTGTRSTTEHLTASIHRGIGLLDNQRKSPTFRRSSFRFSYKHTELKPILPIERVDVGIQTSPESSKMQEVDSFEKVGVGIQTSPESSKMQEIDNFEKAGVGIQTSPESSKMQEVDGFEKVDVGIETLPESVKMTEVDGTNHLCSNCKRKTLHGDVGEDNDPSILQLVPVDRSLSAEKPKKIPKAVQKVLAGAIRREMALEDYCAKQSYEIAQLNRLVQQYKHERECNAIIGQMRDDKIIRLENLMDGVLPTEDFMEEELLSVRKEHEILKEKFENHPEVLESKIELKRVQDELERLRSFFDMGERDVLLEEIHDLRSQLQYYTDSSPVASKHRKSILKLTYPCEQNSVEQNQSLQLNPIPETTEENVAEKFEQERAQWNEVESQWISLAEELKLELESCRSHSELLERELEAEKKCSEELKEALQLAMEGQARILEQHANLEEKHMQMLSRHRQMQDGIEDVKKAAAKAGVRGAESRFINALAAEISALKVEREKERRYFRDENKMLHSQLRDTAEALQAAGELLVRLKEGEEAVTLAEKRAAMAEEETKKAHNQIDELKKKHEAEITALNQIISESHLPKDTSHDQFHTSNEAKFDTEDRHSVGDERWKEEFQPFYNIDDEMSSKFADPSSWFSGYDKCNI